MKYTVYGIGGDDKDHLIAEGLDLETAKKIAFENEGNYLLGTNIVDENGNEYED